MKKIGLATLLVLASIVQAPAGELGHYAPGLPNIHDFFVPEPGWYAMIYNFYYTSDTYCNSGGHEVNSITINPGPGPEVTLDVDADVDIYTLVPMLLWVPEWKMPGGWRYGAYISPTFGNSSISAALSAHTTAGLAIDESQFDIGDLFVQPLWFGWSGKHFDCALGYGFYAPIGKYDTDVIAFPGTDATITSPEADNIGLGYWTHQLQTAFAWYPWENRATTVALAVTGEVHGNKEDVDIRPGARISLNWGICQYLPLKSDKTLLMEIGLSGYSQWQVSDDSGSDAQNTDVHDRIHAAGLQLGVTYAPWNAFVTGHYLHEFGARDRFEGQIGLISFGKKF